MHLYYVKVHAVHIFIEKMINDNYTCFLYNSESVTSSIGSEHLFVPTRRRGIIKL